MEEKLVKYLSNYLTANRFNLFNQLVENRTRYLTVVLEDIYQSQNASAVLRTCDCFGIQDVHVVENYNKFDVNPKVALGASKWLSIHHYKEGENNTLEAIKRLKADGYRIVATSPHENDVNLEDFDLAAGKSALVFGTELKGISDSVRENADEFMKIPMYGFTESFNISVSAAIILHYLTHQLKQSTVNWKLTGSQRNEILLEWLKKSVRGSDQLIRKFEAETNL